MTRLLGSAAAWRRLAAMLSVGSALATVEGRAQAPTIVTQPLPLAIAPGDRGGFVVEATGAAPLSYQWYRDGVAVQEATADLLLLPNAREATAGDYSVIVSNTQGAETSAAAHLGVAPYSTKLVDLAYPAIPGDWTMVTALSDGRVLIVRNKSRYDTSVLPVLRRCAMDGSLDPSFAAVLPSGTEVNVAAIAVQNDGRILVGGETRDASDQPTPFLRRLNGDGSIDGSFVPPPLSKSPGGIILSGNQSYVSVGSELIRLNANGSVDPSFAFERQNSAGYEQTIGVVRVDSMGRLLVAFGDMESTVLRLKTDGSHDSSFGPVVVPIGRVLDLVPLPSGGLLVGRRTALNFPGGSVVAGTFLLNRYTDGGVEDPSFHAFSFSATGPAGGGGFADVALQDDGRILVAGDFTALPAGGNLSYARPGLVRLMPDGTIDSSYAVLDLPKPYSGEHRLIQVLPGGRQVLLWRSSAMWRINLASVGAPQPPRILRVVPATNTVSAGDDLKVELVAVGTGPLRCDNSLYPASVVDDLVTWPDVQVTTRTFVVSGLGGTARSENVTVIVAPSVPHIIAGPDSIVTSPGYMAWFAADARGSGPMRYEWFKDGVSLGEATSYSRNLGRSNISLADVGTYTLRVTNELGFAEKSATLTFGPHSELVNLSARASVGAGERVLIAGFVISGAGKNQVYIRGVGPELTRLGVRSALPDPKIHLTSTNGTDLTNDDGEFNWFTVFGALPWLNYGTKSAAFIPWVDAGVYNLQVSGAPGTTGVALAEVYDSHTTTMRLINLSGRAYVGSGEDVLIAGFVISGDKPKDILVRAIGPGLLDKGVVDVLRNPILTVVNPATRETIAVNDDWESTDDPAGLRATMARVGAFPLVAGSQDAVLRLTLQPGVYTAVVSGVEETSGVALVEVYDAD